MKRISLLFLLVLALQACRKDFLDERPNKALLVPTTLADLQVLLDNTQVFNLTPNLTAIADGDYVAEPKGLPSYNLDMERNSYIWAKDIFAGMRNIDWNNLYKQVFYANIVLEGMDKLPADQQRSAQGMSIRGTALFFRAVAFYNLAGMFAAPYRPGNLNLPGVPLRLQADVTARVDRGTLQATYARILADLSAARALLPQAVTVKTRPTITAAWAMHARISLAMADYPAAGKYADSVIAGDPALLDYNQLNPAASRPFPRVLPYGNDEVIWHSALMAYSFDPPSAITAVVPELYNSYAANDLRKQLFFTQRVAGKFTFRGNYSGVLVLFGGLAADETYLIRAECRARAGDLTGAMSDLNTLLSKRWVKGTFVPLNAGNAGVALELVLQERRKELLGRNLRWSDVRRLNLSLQRTLNGQEYRLDAGSPRQVYPIPDDEIRLNGIPQNPR